ncbi:DUF1853 family protein [Billgrantia endophytica]|uniref:DUF1853 domain-containing protein n=1 Tax=Billgrantia endophytica TaxID=2033802 RepID=A0A2N7UAL6_9GAMM|nr:DUF1853 family protein [Halomonas endophytica]PMR77487.1 DUF1853 domain-containing protein [Halomonas endophytica]
MLPSSAALLTRCHHPLVRDLAWLVLAPDLITTPCQGRPTRKALGLEDDHFLATFLAELDKAPQALERRVGNTNHGRMGHYHERIWQFLLDAAPGTRLLAHNLRIHEGKRTLGELDLIYRLRDDPMPIHLEVAIKYYLGLPEGPGEPSGQARWIGPGGVDSLATKREHLHRHQLRLTEREETRVTLQRHLHPRDLGPLPELVIRPQLAMPGVLFYPWQQNLPPPREATTGHLQGQWLRWSDWQAFRQRLPRETRGAWLAKPHWLALPREDAFIALEKLEARLEHHFADPASPVQVALAQGRGKRMRLFLVADDWPRQIPLPPVADGIWYEKSTSDGQSRQESAKKRK